MSPPQSVALRRHCGAEVLPHLDAVAQLRIAVFAGWPYLYAGNVEYERRYLGRYAASPRCLFVLAVAGGEVVGATTALPLDEEDAAIREPLERAGLDPRRVAYFGESVLLPEWHGQGIGHRFFDEREAWARGQGGFTHAVFCAVERDADDTRRPPGARSLEAFWSGRGYVRQDGVSCRLDWPEEPGGADLPHSLTFWLRPLEPA